MPVLGPVCHLFSGIDVSFLLYMLMHCMPKHHFIAQALSDEGDFRAILQYEKIFFNLYSLGELVRSSGTIVA